ncbi:MAG: hypothetical protein KBG62_01555 [Propionivibrio sp.]|nr:hypothetical protein [Propionivibrio sp.]
MSGEKNSHVDLIDSLLMESKKPEDLVGEHGLLKKISNALMERTVHAERDHISTFQVREIDRC